MYPYELNDFQLELINDIENLPKKNLHYITAQQSNIYPNLTLKEFKKLIKRAIRKYIEELILDYRKGLENQLLKYYCVFETTKEFNLNISHKSFSDLPSMGLHFHMFISTPDDYPWVNFDSLTYQIFCELTSLKHKRSCISKYGYYKIDNLDDKFKSYHTKQFINNPSPEMIMKN